MKKVLICLALLIFLCGFSGCAEEKGYEEIKAEAVSLLEQNQMEMERIAADTIENSVDPESEAVEGVAYIKYDKENGYVVFAIDAQGMLGGQYWSLVYTPNGTYNDQPLKYTWDEESGNNRIIAEKIADNWFFLWEDYDGREDLLNIQ